MKNINSYLICGSVGVGKTTYAVNKWNNHLFIDCDNPLSNVHTYSIIEQAIYSSLGKHFKSNEQLIKDLYTSIANKCSVILDNVEKIDIELLKLIINIVRILQKNIIFIFNYNYNKLYKSEIFNKLLEWDIIYITSIKKDFQADLIEIEKFICDNYSPSLKSDIQKIINITGYNFNNIKKLLWINYTKNNNAFLSNSAVLEYLQDWLEIRFEDISKDSVEILKKSSVIGEIFNKYILEDENGFNIFGVSAYLDELEGKKTFISKYVERKDYYKFITYDIYRTILSTVTASQKSEWKKVLQSYYFKLFLDKKFEDNKLELLTKIKEISIALNDNSFVYSINHVILNEYIKIGDHSRTIMIIDELIKVSSKEEQKIFIDYLLALKLKLLINEGSYKAALLIINNFLEDKHFKGSRCQLKYYHIKCLYNCGNVDKAYLEIKKLVSELKLTAKNGFRNQEIYPLSYSMMASIQNHLNIDDEGYKYYILALNYAYNKIDNKDIYYDILRKNSMFFSSNEVYINLKKCIQYYEQIGDTFQASRVYFNLATEMMFDNSEYKKEICQYLNYSKEIFAYIPNENLAYAKNNLALFYILFNNDITAAITELEGALFIGLSDFTYMTIYLNLSMCYFIILGNKSKKFKKSYKNFLQYENLIEKRDNNTKYEIMYRTIAQLIFDYSPNTVKQDIEICQNLLTKDSTSNFFKPVIEDIKDRMQNNIISKAYLDNSYFYRRINELGIFLAEFRFWD